MLVLLPLLLAVDTSPDTAAAGVLANYETLTSATPACSAPSGEDVVVCGRRAADRYRAPLIVHEPGDPAHEGVPEERDRLFAKTNNCEEKSLFLVGCGSAGVTASTSSGVHLSGERPIAP